MHGFTALAITLALLLGTSGMPLRAAEGGTDARSTGATDSADQQARLILAAGTDPVRLAWALWRPPPGGSPQLNAALNHALIAAGQVADRQWRTLLLDLASDDLVQGDGEADQQALAVLIADRVHDGAIALLTARHPQAYAALLATQCASSSHGLDWLAATEVALAEQAHFLAAALLPQCRLELVIRVDDPLNAAANGGWYHLTSGDGYRTLPHDAPGDVVDLLSTDAVAGAIVVATTPRLVVVQRQVLTAAHSGFGSNERPIDDRELIWQELHLLAHQQVQTPARQDLRVEWGGADAYVRDITRLRQDELDAWQQLRAQLIALQVLDPHLVVPLSLRIAVVDQRAVHAPPLPPLEGVEFSTADVVSH